MPLVPSQEDKISTDVPGLDVGANRFGQVGAAAAQAGAGLQSTASTIVEHVKRMEAVSSSQTAAMQANVDGENYLNKLKANSPDGYVYLRDANNQMVPDSDGNNQRVKNDDGSDQTITQNYRNWANDRYQKDQLKLPSDIAQQMYQQEAGKRFTGDIDQLQHEELALRAQDTRDNLEINLHTLAVNRGNNPDHEKAYADYEAGVKQIISTGNVGGMPASEVQQRIIKWGQELSSQTIEGEIRAIQNDINGDKKHNAPLQMRRIQDLLDVINGKPAVGRYRDPLEELATGVKGGNFYEGKTQATLEGGGLEDTSMSERRMQEGHPAMTHLLGDTQKWRLTEKLEAMKRGTSANVDWTNLGKMKEGLIASYTAAGEGVAGALSQESIDSRAQTFAQQSLQALEMDSNHPGAQMQVAEDITEVIAKKYQAMGATTAHMFTPDADQQARIDFGQKAFLEQAGRVADQVNAHYKGSNPPLDRDAFVDIVRARYQPAAMAALNTNRARRQSDFGGFFRETSEGTAIAGKTLDQIDVKSGDDFSLLSDWKTQVDARKKTSGTAYKDAPFMPNDFAKSLAERIMAPGQNPEQQSKLMGDLAAVPHDAGNAAIRELSERQIGGVPYRAQFANMLPPGKREDYMQALLDKHVIADQYEAAYSAKNGKTPDNANDSKALAGIAQKYFGPQFLAAGGSNPKLGGDPTQVAIGMRETVVNKAMQNYVADGGKLSPEEYIKGAGAKFMDMFYAPNKAGWFSGRSDQNIALPKNSVVGGPVPQRSMYSKVTMDESGKAHYLTPDDAQSISNLAESIKSKGSQLVDKYGAVDPKTLVNGVVNPKADVAPEDYKYFLDSSGAKLQEQPVIRRGQWGIGFTHAGTNPDGSYAQPVNVMSAGKDGVAHRLFIPLPVANAAGKGLKIDKAVKDAEDKAVQAQQKKDTGGAGIKQR